MLAVLQALAGAIAALASLLAAFRDERRLARESEVRGKSAAFDRLAQALAARRKVRGDGGDAGAGGLPVDRYRRD